MDWVGEFDLDRLTIDIVISARFGLDRPRLPARRRHDLKHERTPPFIPSENAPMCVFQLEISPGKRNLSAGAPSSAVLTAFREEMNLFESANCAFCVRKS
jgi:hypothetical protein